jgi:hypothetical protein
MALSKDQILSADDMGLLEVAVPEWGGSVFRARDDRWRA